MKIKNKKIMRWIIISSIVIVIIGVAFIILATQKKLTVKQAGDIIAGSIETSFSQIKQDDNALIATVLEDASVTVLSTDREEGVVLAHCKVKSKDAYSVIKNIDTTYGDVNITLAKILEIYERELEQTDFKEYDVDVILKKEEGEWVVEYTYEFLNALTGGYLQYSSEVMEELVVEE